MATCGSYANGPSMDDLRQEFNALDANHDGTMDIAEYSAARGGVVQPISDCDDCDDCVQLVRTVKRVQVPCTRPQYSQYTVKVPRTVMEQVPRTVNYTEQETRTRQVPYTVNREETRFRAEQQSYSVPKVITKTRMVNVTKKVPKTIYVDVVTQEPQSYQETISETKYRQVRIPYKVNIPETRYRVENYSVPVTKSRTVMDNVSKTVYDMQVRNRCTQVTKMVTKEVPVYRVVTKPPAPCAGGDCEPCAQVLPEPIPYPPQPPMEKEVVTTKTVYSAPAQYDADGNGILDEEEREQARKDGVLEVEDKEVTVQRGQDFRSQATYQSDYTGPNQPDKTYGQETGYGYGAGAGAAQEEAQEAAAEAQKPVTQAVAPARKSSSRRRKSSKKRRRRKSSRN